MSNQTPSLNKEPPVKVAKISSVPMDGHSSED